MEKLMKVGQNHSVIETVKKIKPEDTNVIIHFNNSVSNMPMWQNNFYLINFLKGKTLNYEKLLKVIKENEGDNKSCSS